MYFGIYIIIKNKFAFEDAGRKSVFTAVISSYSNYNKVNNVLLRTTKKTSALFGNTYLKLYCRYEYTKPCMINCIWGLKTTMTPGEWTCLISFATAPLTSSERGGSEKFKMKIYVSSGIRTHTSPVHDRRVSALDRSATKAWWWSVV